MLPTDTRLGPYQILALVGEGGMGQVYAAYDEELDRRVAIKLLHRKLGASASSARPATSRASNIRTSVRSTISGTRMAPTTW